jgi:hypothetical protein
MLAGRLRATRPAPGRPPARAAVFPAWSPGQGTLGPGRTHLQLARRAPSGRGEHGGVKAAAGAARSSAERLHLLSIDLIGNSQMYLFEATSSGAFGQPATPIRQNHLTASRATPYWLIQPSISLITESNSLALQKGYSDSNTISSYSATLGKNAIIAGMLPPVKRHPCAAEVLVRSASVRRGIVCAGDIGGRRKTGGRWLLDDLPTPQPGRRVLSVYSVAADCPAPRKPRRASEGKSPVPASTSTRPARRPASRDAGQQLRDPRAAAQPSRAGP